MKKLMMVLTFLLGFGTLGFGQVPDVVQTAFKAKHAGAATADWQQKAENWQATFQKDGQTLKAVFDAQGAWLKTKWDIAINVLPSTIQEQLSSKYAGFTVYEAEKIEQADGTILYEAGIKNDAKELEVEWSEAGEMIKEIPKDD